jgi:hypothetical protein
VIPRISRSASLSTELPITLGVFFDQFLSLGSERKLLG